jgi:hypothetical protein
MLSVSDVYTADSLLQSATDFETKTVRGDKAASLPSRDGMVALAVRTSLSLSSQTPLTPSAIELVLPKTKEDGQSQQFNPVGSVQHGERLLLMRPDDQMYGSQMADYVFVVPVDALVAGETPDQKALPAGSFLCIGRSARSSLLNRAIADAPPADSKNVGLKEKTK